ncbi:unnamed protein product [Knipowitschia caucasica]
MDKNEAALLTRHTSPRSSTSSESEAALNTQDYHARPAPDFHPANRSEDFRSQTPQRGPPAVPVWVGLTQATISDKTDSSHLRDLSATSFASSSIPLTGDKKADADIMAFVKAREKLLQKTRQPQ